MTLEAISARETETPRPRESCSYIGRGRPRGFADFLVDSARGSVPYLETSNGCGRDGGRGTFPGLPLRKQASKPSEGIPFCMCVMYRQNHDITYTVLGLKVSCAGSEGGRQQRFEQDSVELFLQQR